MLRKNSSRIDSASEDDNNDSVQGPRSFEDPSSMLEGEFNLTNIHNQVLSFITKLLPQAILLRDFNGNFVYQIPIQGFNAERLFLEMERSKERLHIADWGISQCSLEDVFTRICGGDA